MRLLRTDGASGFSLHEFTGDAIPSYAILSHTWGADNEEVTYKDFAGGNVGSTAHYRQKPGYQKIEFCALRAMLDNLNYFWVDSCCIDKSSSTELSEAIISMFQWYEKAKRCYVYLTDVSVGEGSTSSPEFQGSLQASRWFTRGWTLQELLAPQVVEFYSVEGNLVGDKISLMEQIHQITHIPTTALSKRTPLAHFTVDERMSWIKNRQTKRGEDLAYCLFGIFNVHMPLLYGEEQEKAFIRLKREIATSSGTESLLPVRRTRVLADPSFFSSLSFKQKAFTGREDELRLIDDVLRTAQQQWRMGVVGLHGMGGIGKTQIAARYINEHKQTFRHVLWVNAGSSDCLKQSFGAIAVGLDLVTGLEEDFQSGDHVRRVINWMEEACEYQVVAACHLLDA